MIDVHCHLNFHAFEKDYDQVIKRAEEKGVEMIINVGTQLNSSEKAIELAEQYENCYAIVGVHPHHADKKDLNQEIQQGVTGVEGISMARTKTKSQEYQREGNDRQDPGNWLMQLEKLAKQPKVVAIGEIGMDYYHYQSNGITDPKMQEEIFIKQIELANSVNLPIQIHNRHAGHDVIKILKKHKQLLKQNYPGMFHCFAGDMEILRSALDLGFYIGFDGNSTYPGLAPGEAVSLSELIKATPLDRIVTETDSPFLTPVPFRGSRNEPSHVILVGEFLAKVKDVSFDQVNVITTQNAKKLFGL